MLSIVKTVVFSDGNVEDKALASKHISLLMYFIAVIYGMHPKKLPLPFNNISLSVLDPYLIRSRSVRIFRPFWNRFNLFPCCAICFAAWQFMILIKERACMLFNRKNGFQRLHQKRILFYHAKGSHASSHHTHAHSHHAHAQSHTSLRFAYFFAPVPSASLVVLLYRSWLQHWITLNFSITHEQV